MLTDVAAERAVLSAICKYGHSAYIDISDLIRPSTFSINTNRLIFQCVQHIFEQNVNAKIDVFAILSAAQSLGFSHIIERQDELKHVESVLKFPAVLENLRTFSLKLRRLEIARQLYTQCDTLKEKLSEYTGKETIPEVLSWAEDALLNFSLLETDADSPKHLGSSVQEYVDYLLNNPGIKLGIPSGYNHFDYAIGGGLLPGALIIGARPKQGKTTLAINVGYNVARNNIPVLYCDSEMIEHGLYRDISVKLLARISQIDIGTIKHSNFKDDVQKNKVIEASKIISSIPFYRYSIAGKSFEEGLYAIRRWVHTVPKVNLEGTANPCLIIYDYLKLNNDRVLSDHIRENQLLGYYTTALQTIGLQYSIPILVFTQLNRDGITRETSDIISGSDRLSWFATSITIFKDKSPEEIAKDGPQMGNKKLVNIMSRYGPGHSFGEYINVHMNKRTATIVELSPFEGFDVEEEVMNEEDEQE